MADLDEFKRINDVHGHGVGDEVLKCFIERVRRSIRKSSDWIARYGGEEFVLVLPESELTDAAAVAEKIRSPALRNRWRLQQVNTSLRQASVSPDCQQPSTAQSMRIRSFGLPMPRFTVASVGGAIA